VLSFFSTLLTFVSHSSLADASRSHSDAHSSRTDDHWPSTDFFQSFSISVRDAGESGDAGDTDSGEDGEESGGGCLGLRFDEGLKCRYFRLENQNRTLSSVEDNSTIDLNWVGRILRR